MIMNLGWLLGCKIEVKVLKGDEYEPGLICRFLSTLNIGFKMKMSSLKSLFGKTS